MLFLNIEDDLKMIQALYIFQSNSKDLLYNKSFQSEEKLEMFESFFSALQTFVSELTDDSKESLNTIELGAYFVLITRISEFLLDLVIITDREDIKEVQKLIPKINEIILSYQDLFTDWDGKPEKFEMFDLKIIKLILSDKKLIAGSSLTTDQSTILKSIWEQKGSLSDQLREDLSKERDELMNQYLNEKNFLEKYKISKKLIDISFLKDEIKDRKLRLQYYLDRVKESLEYSRYAETYSCLYSFCIKLEDLADTTFIMKYRTLAETLLKRDKIPKDKFKESLQEISKIEQEFNENVSLDSL